MRFSFAKDATTVSIAPVISIQTSTKKQSQARLLASLPALPGIPHPGASWAPSQPETSLPEAARAGAHLRKVGPGLPARQAPGQSAPRAGRAPRLWGVVVDGTAPGGGKSLSGAAAASANRNAKGRGPSQSASGGRAAARPGPSWARGWVCPGRGGRFRVGILIVMDSKAKVGRKELLLFASVVLCKFANFGKGRWVGTEVGARRPHGPARSRDGPEPAGLALRGLSTPGAPCLPRPPSLRAARSAPLPDTRRRGVMGGRVPSPS